MSLSRHTIFDRIKEKLKERGIEPGSEPGKAWIASKARQMRATPERLMFSPNVRGNTMIGKMYFYWYDPKTKDKLSRWDKFPLVIPIERYGDGFLGLNLHYVSESARAGIIGSLSEYLNNKNYDSTTRFRLSYDMLKRASKISVLEPCIKRYLFSHVRSGFLEIPADEWDIAILLPVQRFESKR